MQFIVLRHGRTQANEDNLYVGAHLDLPLSKNGRADARTCGCSDKVTSVFVSPMLRARETARICFPQARQIPLEALREMDFGAFEGRSPDSMENDAAYRAWVDSMCTTRCPDGETRDEFTRRVADTVEGLLIDASAYGTENVTIVAHSGTVLAAMDTFAHKHGDDHKKEDTYFSWLVSNGEGYRASVEFDAHGRPYFMQPEHFVTLDFLRE